MIGDFSSVEAEEGRLHVPTGQLRYENSATEAAIETSFGDHVEVVAAGYCRRHFRDGQLDTLSRADRCFVSGRWIL